MAAQPPAPVIVVGCQKGGIGRTAIAVNLAAMLALAGRRTLLVDLDPKGDATVAVGLQPVTDSRSLERLSDPWRFLKDTVSASVPPGLDVWPGGPAIQALHQELSQESEPPLGLLDRGLSLARQRYRAIVIDAPPDLGPLACNALAAVDVLLLPLPEHASGFERALEDTVATASTLRADVEVYGVRLGGRDDLIVEAPEGEDDDLPARGPLGIELLDCTICYDAKVFSDAASQGLPVFEWDPSSRVSRCFLELGREVLAKVVSAGSRSWRGSAGSGSQPQVTEET